MIYHTLRGILRKFERKISKLGIQEQISFLRRSIKIRFILVELGVQVVADFEKEMTETPSLDLVGRVVTALKATVSFLWCGRDFLIEPEGQIQKR